MYGQILKIPNFYTGISKARSIILPLVFSAHIQKGLNLCDYNVGIIRFVFPVIVKNSGDNSLTQLHVCENLMR